MKTGGKVMRKKRLGLAGLGLALAAIVVLCSVGVVKAQNVPTGAITGTVTDPNGAAVAGATVTVIDQNKGFQHGTTTDTSGFYTVESLVDGTYTVTISKDGFKQGVTTDVHLDPGQRRGLNLTLALGNTTQQVTVTADAVSVQTQSSDNRGTISAAEVQNLPLNGRNFQNMAQVVSGVSSVDGGSSLTGNGNGVINVVIVNGTSVEKTAYSLDGVYDTVPAALFQVDVMPVIDSIAEFTVLKGNYSAKYGMAGSGEIIVETKSGTTQYHGTGYDYIRNPDWTARNFFSTTPSPLRQNIYGYDFGGPVIPHSDTHRDKLFFFADGEWRKSIAPSILNARNEFSAAMRTGDLSGDPNMPAGGLTLSASATAALMHRGYTNPTAQCLSAKTGSTILTQINPSCFDPVTVALMIPTYLPLPNTATTSNPFSYTNNGITNDTQQDQVYKVDYAITEKEALMARVSYEESDNINAARNYNDPSPTPGSSTYTPGMNAGIRWTSDFTPNLINVAAIGLAWTKGDSRLSNYTMPLCGTSACITQAYPGADTLNRLPNLELTGSGTWSWIGEGALPTDTTDSDAIYSDDVTWVKHNQIFQFGGLYLRGNKSQSSGTFPAPMGVYTFSGAQSGDTAADFMLGLDSTYQQANVQRAGYFHYGWWELYFQDDWKVTPRLTLNLGVRWSYFQPETVVTNDLTSFETSAYNAATAPAVSLLGAFTFNSSGQPLTPGGAVANLTDGLVTAGEDSSATLPVSSEPGFYKSKDRDFAPRLGFAYALTSDGKTALRGGFGMGYTPVALERNPAFLTNPPFTQSVSTNNGLTSQPLVGTAPGSPTITPTSLFAFNGDFQPTETESYSLFIERQLTSSAVVNVGYVGNKSQHVTDEAVNENFPLNESNSLSPSCAALSSNPLNSTANAYKGPVVVQQYDPCINALPSGTTTESIAGIEDADAPYQGWTSISGTYSEGIANYNALQSSFILRRKDLNLNFAYTWSKSLTDVQPGGQGISYDQAGGFQNPNNPMAEYGEPDFDRTNVFTGAWVYQTPFFKDSSSQAVRTALAGWNFSGLAIIENGFALTPTLGTANVGLATRPNIVGPIQYLNTNAANGWVSPASFQQPAYGTFGDETIGNIRGPGEVSFNIALDKQFQIHERFNIQLRGEAFNVFNHTNFSTLNLTWNSPTSTTFGHATGALDPRIIELMARFNF
jgi:hypothetical protein